MSENTKTISAYTLGCKVNQYDTGVMLESFVRAGYRVVPFGEKSDVVLINTCTVTGTGDNKSLKTIRHCARVNPDAAIVVAGCLAQRDAQTVAQIPGVRVVLGTQAREQAVTLLEQALREDSLILAVKTLAHAPFEESKIDAIDGHTRAVLKIQEGCENRCTYCVIPQVRGPVRSRTLASIRSEIERLCSAGFLEIVLTGIHLNSYGKDTGASLAQAAAAALEAAKPFGARIRLGSLEPTVHDEALAQTLRAYDNFCPQFHLALQSGSDSVLARMRRRYNTQQYERSVRAFRNAFENCAVTTDIIAGFPGETKAEFEQTLAFIRQIGFARIHVFPYSQRSGTPAAQMPDQVPVSIRQQRAGVMIEAGRETAQAYLNAMLGKRQTLLVEREIDGMGVGYTETYLRCVKQGAKAGTLVPVVPRDVRDGVLYDTASPVTLDPRRMNFDGGM
jgi:threonylcarbamoyladenosine tRNA methylthiotransferase MtaB